MKMFVIAARDNRIETFTQPSFVAHTGAAMRAFTEHCSDDSSAFKKHPEDFDLYCLGEFDDQTGEFYKPDGYPMRLLRAVDIVQKSAPVLVANN